MNRKAATIFCVLMLGASLITRATDWAPAGSPSGGPDEMSVRIMHNDIVITCPDRVTYQAQPISGWSVGMFAIKQLMFKDATVAGRILNCNYSALRGEDSSILMREMPAGYVCTTDSRPNYKNWQFLCKRAVAPIKIKPKTD